MSDGRHRMNQGCSDLSRLRTWPRVVLRVPSVAFQCVIKLADASGNSLGEVSAPIKLGWHTCTVGRGAGGGHGGSVRGSEYVWRRTFVTAGYSSLILFKLSSKFVDQSHE